MPSPTSISVAQLARLIGRPDCPTLIDVCTDEDFAANPRLIPGAVRRPWASASSWAGEFVAPGKPVIVICKRGLKLSEGAAAWLRHAGVSADNLEGGVVAWQQVGQPMLDTSKMPPRDDQGRTVWVTRSRPKIDRIACPWLIRRFVDPNAVFLYVAASEVLEVAERFGATPFDIEADGVMWTHRGEFCTFDVMVEAFGLRIEPLLKLATIVRGADTGRPELAPESAGLLAASLGQSRMYADDLEQLEAGLALYDAFYRWCRDASEEAHGWPPAQPARAAKRTGGRV